MQLARWGNSLAIRVPANVVNELGLKEGDEVDIVARRDRFEISRAARRDSALATIRALARPLPPGWKIDQEAGDGRGDDRA